MQKRIRLSAVTFLFALFAAANGASYAQTKSSGAKSNGNSQPVAPNIPEPLRPLDPTPPGPTPGAPNQAPAAVYPTGPTAEQDSVLLRPRPEFQPTGLDLGLLFSGVGSNDSSTGTEKHARLSSFVLSPKLEFETLYDSNLFRTKSETSDKIFIVSPSVSIRSDWVKHALEFLGAANIARYNRTTTEDYEDILARISGRAELYDNLSVRGSVQFNRQHQQRGELIDPGDTSKATIINHGRAQLGTELDLAAVTLSVDAVSESSKFVSSSTVDNGDLDHDKHTVTARASVEIDSGTSVFLQPKYNRRIYDRKVDDSGFEKDSHGYEVIGGIRWDASGVTFAELGLGYLWQDFNESRFATIKGATASAQAIWNFSDLWTLTFGLSREVSETADPDFSGVLETKFNSRLDYEFLYNTIFSLRFKFSNEDFKSSTRLDQRTIGGFRVKHLFNQNLFAEFDIRHERLSSNRDDEDYRVTSGSLRLGAQI